MLVRRIVILPNRRITDCYIFDVKTWIRRLHRHTCAFADKRQFSSDTIGWNRRRVVCTGVGR